MAVLCPSPHTAVFKGSVLIEISVIKISDLKFQKNLVQGRQMQVADVKYGVIASRLLAIFGG